MASHTYVGSDLPADIKGFDIIGDIHGCANTLELLLKKLGYQMLSGVYQHPSRMAVFVGDVVDRGPHIREALQLVKSMVDAGAALCILGNHEYNAIGYTTAIKPKADAVAGKLKYLRSHNARHNRLIAETLEQFAGFPEEWRMYLEWFKGLPLFLELPGFRVVHACWDRALIEEFKQRYGRNTLDDDFLQDSVDKTSFAGQVMDRLTRGTDLPLPDGESILSKDGYERRSFRTKFWSRNPKSYLDVVFQPDPLPDHLSGMALTEREKAQLLHYPPSEPPVFVGHYWLQGTPKPLRDNVACLDYSAVKYGRLVAYQYDGEAALKQEKFQWVYVNPES